jgi:hypothetical protein
MLCANKVGVGGCAIGIRNIISKGNCFRRPSKCICDKQIFIVFVFGAVFLIDILVALPSDIYAAAAGTISTITTWSHVSVR